MSQVRRTLRLRRCSLRNEKCDYCCIRFFIRNSFMRRALGRGEADVRAFLEYFSVEHKVGATTQNQALNAIGFPHTKVRERPLGEIRAVTRARQPMRLPVVLTHEEVMAVSHEFAPGMQVMALLMYSSGLRVTEVCRLPARYVDFGRAALTVLSGKEVDRVRCCSHPSQLIDAPLGPDRRRRYCGITHKLW
jgi:site-specific recombinase XerD